MNTRIITAIIIAFTLMQLLIILVFDYTPYPDSEGYLFLANEALSKGEPYPVTSLLSEYPFLWNAGAINAVYLSLKITGSIIPLLIIYSLMKGATAWLLFAIARTTTDQHTAFIALLLYVLYPANYGESTSLLSELPFLFFSLLGIYLSICKQQHVAGSIAIAIGNWIRPMGIIFLIALIIYHLLKRKPTVKLLAGYILTLCFIGTLTYQRTGLFLYQSKTGWMALMQYSWDNHHSIDSDNPNLVSENTQWNVSQKDSVWQAMFIDWLKENPKQYIAQMPRKLVNTYVSDNVNFCAFLPNKTNSEYLYEPLSMASIIHDFPRYTGVQILTIINLVIYYIILITSILSLRNFTKRSHLFPVAIILLGTFLLLLVGHGEARFHQPFMPFFILLSALFWRNKKTFLSLTPASFR